jgi:methyl-accepting chemotaxis protein
MMSFKNKLVIGAIFLTVLPIITCSLLLIGTASQSSHEMLQELSNKRLIATRDFTKAHIEDYLNTIRKQILTASSNRSTIDAMRQFSAAIWGYREQLGIEDIAPLRRELSEYYQGDFTTEYQRRNSNRTIDTAALLANLDDNAVLLQHAFIRANPHPLGEKHLLDQLEGNTDYALFHNTYHSSFRQYLEEFGYYDIFLADSKTGRIVYSVFKEIDYGTSLKQGSFANSGIGEVFAQANAATDPDFITISDYASYTPSYEDQAAFIASPIFDGDKKLGVLIFQMPIDHINAIMTHNGKWQESGLGESGETYLVGQDGKMRSQSRLLLEDKAGYLQAIRATGYDAELVNLIETKNTSIGLQKIDSESSRLALSGNQGVSHIKDYRGVPVLSAYAPIQVGNIRWAILAEIDETEAYASAEKLSQTLQSQAVVIVVILIIISALVGVYAAKYILKPIGELVGILQIVERDADLTARVNITRKDELGQAGTALNHMLEKFAKSMKQAEAISKHLATAAAESSAASEQSSQATQLQVESTTQLANAMEQMKLAVREVAVNTSSSAASADEAKTLTLEGESCMREMVAEIQKLAQEINNSTRDIEQLESDSQEISKVLDVIQSIAEQTNLLALNAAIEAARAGDKGRGFAVVADEVRSLASRTQDSTEEINQTIQKLQQGTGKAVKAMQRNIGAAHQTVDQGNKSEELFQKITQMVENVSSMSLKIASATEEQSAVSDEINQNVMQINEMATQVAAGVRQNSVTTQEIAEMATETYQIVEQFKV